LKTGSGESRSWVRIPPPPFPSPRGGRKDGRIAVNQGGLTARIRYSHTHSWLKNLAREVDGSALDQRIRQPALKASVSKFRRIARPAPSPQIRAWSPQSPVAAHRRSNCCFRQRSRI